MRLPISVLIGLSGFLAAPAYADRDKGRDVFRAQCMGCHAMQCNRTGPKLGDLLGRRAGSVEGYGGYSAAMKDSGIVWTEDSLDKFLTDPLAFVPKNGMGGYGQVANAAERADLIDFLAQPDESLDLCH